MQYYTGALGEAVGLVGESNCTVPIPLYGPAGT